jgi:hypothetical protein
MKDILITKTGTQLKDFLAALVAPLQYSGDLTKDFETEQVKRAKWNGRKIVLQAALNNLFGITSPPYIIIEDNQDIGTNLYFFEEPELQPVYFSETVENDPIYFFENSELSAVDYDFKVLIPSGIWTTETERRIKAYTRLYKLAGPTFITEIY